MFLDRKVAAYFLALSASFSLATRSIADGPGTGMTVTGTYSLTLKPQKLRIVSTASAQGKDAADAIKKLAEHKQRVRKLFGEWKAEATSVEFGSPTVSMTVPGIPEAMQNVRFSMMNARMFDDPFGDTLGGGDDSDDDEPALPKVAVVTSSVRADWSIAGEDIDSLAVVAKQLMDQMSKSDVEGKKNKVELDADAQDQIASLLAKYQQRGMSYSSGSDEDAGPQILYVATPSHDQEVLGAKKAYEAAAAEAKLWSESTGIKLGKLTTVVSQKTSVNSNSVSWSSSRRSYRNYATQYFNNHEASESKEAVSSDADSLQITFGVTLTYALGEQ